MTITDERLDLLAICRIPGIKWDLVAREAQRADGVTRLLEGEVLEQSRSATEVRDRLAAERDTLDERRQFVHEQHDLASRLGARLVTVLDDDYPENLRVIVNLPPFLYVRGQLRWQDRRAVAVVGTRDASPSGLDKARRMARLLAENGVTVVSGLARGIDSAAHTASLEAGGRTIAVMGTGILHCYPHENADLAERIAGEGALVSQFWPSAPPRSHNFPMRNVVTSGISQGTVVIEASSTSGAKMQARLAIEHGKTVFLVESLVLQQKWARDYVQRHGRKVVVVRSVDDVLAHLRSPEQVEELTVQRRQLAFDLG